MKLEVGMYVRYKKYGQIEKIIEYKEYDVCGELKVKINGFKHYKKNLLKHISKASHNIIDLIEVGDILTIRDILGNTSKVEVDETFKLLSGKIVSIVTKEQFSSMEYRLGE